MPSDPLKKAVAEVAKRPFLAGVELEGAKEGYEVLTVSGLQFHVRVRTDHGPRYFLVKVSESL